MIKCGILCVPAYDETAVDAVRRMLGAQAPGTSGIAVLADRHVISQRFLVEEALRRWCDEDELDLVLTIGGTLPAPGPGATEIVPEATLAVLERLMPGLPEAMRAYAQEEAPLALLDRGVAGIRGRTLIVNLPAGAAGATLFLEAITDVLTPVVAHLRGAPDAPRLSDALAPTSEKPQAPSPAASESENPDLASNRRGLDAEEFAAYLRRRTSGT